MKRFSFSVRQVVTLLLLCLLLLAPFVQVNASGGFGDLNDTLGVTNYNPKSSIDTGQPVSLNVGSQLTEKINLIQESIKKLADKPDYALLGVMAQFIASTTALFLGLGLYEKYERWRTRPIFEISIYPEEPDGVRVSFGDMGSLKLFTYCYALCIRNAGLRKMENVEVIIEEKYDRIGVGEYKLDQRFTSINLNWSNTITNTHLKITNMRAIQPGQHRYCDFGRVDKVEYGTITGVDIPIHSNIALSLETNFRPNTGTTILLPGDYKLKIMFSADDITAESKWYDLKIIDTDHYLGEFVLNNNILFKEGGKLKLDPISLTYKDMS